MSLNTLDKLSIIRKGVGSIPIFYNLLGILQEVFEAKEITEQQADVLGKVLYGWLPATLSLKVTANEEEVSTLILALQDLVESIYEVIEAGTSCFEPAVEVA
jgi:hypothetical protein